MKKVMSALALSGVFLMAGCQTTIKAPYDEKNSLALNYASAGGITGVKDAEVPKDNVSKASNSVASGLFEGSLDYLNADTLNVSSGFGFVMGFLSAVTEPDNAAERSAMFAFMPSHLAADKKEATTKVAKIYQESFQKSLEELGAEDVFIDHGDKYVDVVVYVYGGGEVINCPSEEEVVATPDLKFCTGVMTIQKPKLLEVKETAKWLIDEPSVYYFTAKKDHFYNKVEFDKHGNEAHTASLALLMSKHLPKWMFFYIAPGDTLDDNGEEINFPYILNQGKAHYFVKAKE